MKVQIQFQTIVDDTPQYRWIEERVVTNGRVTIFNRQYEVVDGKVKLHYSNRSRPIESIYNYKYRKRMEDNFKIRVGDCNSWDYIDVSLLYKVGGSWHESYKKAYPEAFKLMTAFQYD